MLLLAAALPLALAPVALATVVVAAALAPSEGSSRRVLVCIVAVPLLLLPVGVVMVAECDDVLLPPRIVASPARALLGMRVKRVVVPSMTVVSTVVSSSGASVCEVVAVPVRVTTSAVAVAMEPREMEVEESSSSLRARRATLRAEVRVRRVKRKRSELRMVVDFPFWIYFYLFFRSGMWLPLLSISSQGMDEAGEGIFMREETTGCGSAVATGQTSDYCRIGIEAEAGSAWTA